MSAIKLPWKNAMRRPARFWLTALSICVAFFLYTVIFAINAALNATGSDNNQFRLMTTHKISITKSVPLNYQNKMNVIEGVDNVTYVSWFGGFLGMSEINFRRSLLTLKPTLTFILSMCWLKGPEQLGDKLNPASS
ncbi:hypothetical protein AC626_12045 [Pseudoalteromonas rubra]|uniref:Uncharacterized protein n=1 Tax=Pseudoalteromonas rubra TaxID=43658 RepID=A0A0L0ERX9_9GAMM|nr:hypothetical protein AC626_12045 [Pseudoalteromonas rubra]